MDKFLKVLKIIGLFLLYAVYMCVILVLARHGLNYFYNEHVLNHYEDGDYSINDNLLLTLNYIEPYIVYFNNGDIYYKNSLYDEAIESYKAALEYDNVPEDRRCKARVNISLSIIAKLPEDYDTYENIPDSIDTLQSAADNLLEEECAKEDGDGHDEDAQKLYDEIIEEIERLKQIQEEQEQQSQPQDGQDQQPQDGQDGDGDGGTGQQPQLPQPQPSPTSQPDDGTGDDDETGTEDGQPMTYEEYEQMIRDQIEAAAQDAYEQRITDLQEYQEWDNDWWNWDDDYDGIW